MLQYNQSPSRILEVNNLSINSFLKDDDLNIEEKTVESFGQEWTKFDQFDEKELLDIGNDYFDIVPESILDPTSTIALDMGCGSGRWSKYLSSRVKAIEAIDPSDSVYGAKHYLAPEENVRVSQASANNIPFDDESFDFVFSLGVLHHMPDTLDGLRQCVNKLKSRGYLLIYLYYALDNRGFIYKTIFKSSTLVRKTISKFPRSLKHFSCDLIGLLVYWPLSRLAWLFRKLGLSFWSSVPLAYYHDKSFKILRNDALDRFGTPLEKRFSRDEITTMLEESGMTNIEFSEKAPYWHVISRKK